MGGDRRELMRFYYREEVYVEEMEMKEGNE